MPQSRNVAFDILKGLGILCVIVGHLDLCADMSGSRLFSYLRYFIYSFHMPLFFIVAGYFYKNGKVRNDIERLVYPYLFVVFVITFILAIVSLFRSSTSFFISVKNLFVRAFWGSGWDHGAPLFGKVPIFLPIWFLGALFCCKRIFGLLDKLFHSEGDNVYSNKTLLIIGLVCLVLSLVFTYVDHKIIYLPFSFNEGLSAIVFFYLGFLVKRTGITEWMKIVLLLFLVLDIIYGGTVGLACCSYSCYPINVVGAGAITYVLYLVCKKLRKITVLSEFLAWCGKNSLLVLCVHSIIFEFRSVLFAQSNLFVLLLINIVGCLVVTALLSKNQIIKQLFKIK